MEQAFDMLLREVPQGDIYSIDELTDKLRSCLNEIINHIANSAQTLESFDICWIQVTASMIYLEDKPRTIRYCVHKLLHVIRYYITEINDDSDDEHELELDDINNIDYVTYNNDSLINQ